MGQLFKGVCAPWRRLDLFRCPSSPLGPCWGTSYFIRFTMRRSGNIDLQYQIHLPGSKNSLSWPDLCRWKEFPFLAIKVTLFRILCDAGHMLKVFSSRVFVMCDWRVGRNSTVSCFTRILHHAKCHVNIKFYNINFHKGKWLILPDQKPNVKLHVLIKTFVVWKIVGKHHKSLNQNM